MNVTEAFAVTDASQVAAPRRAASWLATHLGYSEERAGRAALVASELGTNLVKHAQRGEILMRPVCSEAGERIGLEIVAVDAGPGFRDAGRSREDGYSTAGSLGHGLGSIQRQSDRFDLYTHSTGTVIVASILRNDAAPNSGAHSRYDIGAIHASKSGEDVCGDGWSWRLRDARLAILLADGLGHGLHAHEAARAAVDVFAKDHENPPGRVIEDVHAALRATRGAAVAMLAADLERGTAKYAGVGNIAATIVTREGSRHHLVSHNGTAGHTVPRVQEFGYPVPASTIIVMASDGLGTHWDLSPYPGLMNRSASAIAAVLYRDYSRRRDDVTVVVAKPHPAVAEKL